MLSDNNNYSIQDIKNFFNYQIATSRKYAQIAGNILKFVFIT